MKSKYLISAYFLTLAFCCLIGYFYFLGKNFITLGNVKESFMEALIWAGALILVSVLLHILKTQKSHFVMFFIVEMIVLCSSLLIYVELIGPFNHYFVVSSHKTEIERKVTPTLTNAVQIFSNYKQYADLRLFNYEQLLKTAVANKANFKEEFHKYGLNDTINDQSQINSKIKEMRFNLLPGNFDLIAKENYEWYSMTKQDLEEWKTISVVTNLSLLNQKILSDIEYLNDLSSFRAENENSADFYFSIPGLDILKDFQTEEKVQSKSIFILSLLYVLVFMIYFVAKRNHKSPFGLLNILERIKGNQNDVFIKM